MRKKQITTLAILFIIVIPGFFLAYFLSNRISLQKKSEGIKNESCEEMDGESRQNELSGLEKDKRTVEDKNIALGQFLGMESEKNESVNIVNLWTSIGPYGLNVGSTSKRSGRVTDLEFEGLPSLRVASATGGVWKYSVAGIVVFPVPMGDNIGCTTIGAMATKPNDSNLVIVGTGEPGEWMGGGNKGNGLWRTTNGGITWDSLNIGASGFGPVSYKIKFSPVRNDFVYYANDNGYYMSYDAGASWRKVLNGPITDIEVHPTDSSIVYAVRGMDGLYKSTDGGFNFVKSSTFPVTGSNLGRGCISMSKSNPNIFYIAISNTAGHTYGIIRTTDGGTSWQMRNIKDGSGTDIDFTSNGAFGQGMYDLCVAVNPVNPNIVVAGGVGIYKTTNDGLNWSIISDMHTDQHVAKWHSNGTTLYLGNDGGVYASTDAGTTFTANLNILPTLQYIDFDVMASNGLIHSVGGMQDNNISVTHNATLHSLGTWYDELVGDGYAASIDKGNPNNMVVNYNGYVNRTTNGGTTWIDGTGGGVFQDCTTLRDDKLTPVILYTAYTDKVYKSTNYGGNWSQYGTTLPFNATKMNASSWSYINGTAVYVINQTATHTSNDMLAVVDNGIVFTNRTNSLPVENIRKISVHPTNPQVAFTIMNSTTLTQRVFKTTNRGINWINITGNIPHIYINDLTAHPTNEGIYYAATEFGMLKGTTVDSTVTWVRWMNGMPRTVIVKNLGTIDSSSTTGRFYVVAGTYGRGIMLREASGDDPVGIINGNSQIMRYELSQNYPNPFNPVTNINFTISSNDNVKIEVFDITGRSVNILTNQKYTAGHYSVQFNGNGISSGVYFYRLTTSKFTDVKKMILLK
ncbi:MAG: T9SS type A sorting domain-containing protein [Ignavibacteriae bacterium]|nr:T9SS type A sorting domain-containing protein [Ignavibacteriota bacterium]